VTRYLKVVLKDDDALSLHPNALPVGGGGARGGAGEDEEVTPAYKWWHSKLADFFHKSENYDRKVEVRIFVQLQFLRCGSLFLV
jgi:hypothetical protein